MAEDDAGARSPDVKRAERGAADGGDEDARAGVARARDESLGPADDDGDADLEEGEDAGDGDDDDGDDDDGDDDADDDADGDDEDATGLAALSFDRAEADGSSTPSIAACSRCNASIEHEYYEADGRVVCTPCARALRYGEPGDSGAKRAARALGLGLAAALASGVVWWGIRELTDMEFGFIAIAVGLAVGFAVRAGARGMGGWFHQALAMALTYLAIVSTYVPVMMDAIRYPQPIDAAESSEGVPPPTPEGTPEEAVPAPIAFVIACIIAPATPFLMGFENIIGILLIGFALWEAWRVNKRAVARVDGPYALSRGAESAAA